jgi:N-acetylneuraminic acid mutarotase
MNTKTLIASILTNILLSTPVFADFVFMRESSAGKVVMLQKDQESVSIQLNAQDCQTWALYPDVTPNGKEIIYVAGPDQKNLHLEYKNLETKQTRSFFSNLPGMVLHPKFTKNGKLVFFSAPGKNGKNTVFFMDPHSAKSLDEATALDESEESYFPRPSSDGNLVIYQRNLNGKKEIIFFNRIDHQKTVLAEGMSPTLSFDEQWIAYTSKSEGNWNIRLIHRLTGSDTLITQDSKDEMAPTFMMDNTIAFASNRSGKYKLYKTVQGQWLPLITSTLSDDADYYSPQFTGNIQLKQSLNAPFIGNPRSSFGTITHQGKLYMAGGHQGKEHTYPPESFSDQFLSYDLNTNQWSELAPRPVTAHGYQLAAHGNYIYAFGGFAYSESHQPKWKSLSQIDRYNITTNQWETIGKLNSPRSSNVAVTIGKKVILAAGWDSTPKFENDRDGTFLDQIEEFDLETETIKTLSFKLPLPLRRALTGIEYQGKILLVGGLGQGASHFDLINRVTSIDPLNGASTELTPLPFATFAPAAEILKDRLYVFGGMFKMGEMSYDYVSHIYEMDMKQNSWSHTGRFLQETKGFSQVFKLNDSTLGILGGHHYFEGYDLPVTTFETFSH